MLIFTALLSSSGSKGVWDERQYLREAVILEPHSAGGVPHVIITVLLASTAPVPKQHVLHHRRPAQPITSK